MILHGPFAVLSLPTFLKQKYFLPEFVGAKYKCVMF